MKRKRRIQHSGKLKSYMQWPIGMAILLILMALAVFAVNVRAGCVAAGFTAVYVLVLLVLQLRYRPHILREMIAFASQYAQIQKGMLKSFAIPYAVLDTDGRILWMNDAFCDVGEKTPDTGKISRFCFLRSMRKHFPAKKMRQVFRSFIMEVIIRHRCIRCPWK